MNSMNTFDRTGYVLSAGKWWYCHKDKSNCIVKSTCDSFTDAMEGWLSVREWDVQVGGEAAPYIYGWQPCPYCAAMCECDTVDVGVGVQQCGPYHCMECQASEIGSYDEKRELTDRERWSGWYAPGEDPGSSANVIGGQIVSHKEARDVYQATYPLMTTDSGRKVIREKGIG